MKAMVLCAGKGTRMGTMTERTPKPMLPVNGVPILEHILVQLQKSGVDEVAINLHTGARQIFRHFGNKGWRGMRITYFYERNLLGTAGAIRNMASFVGEDPFLVQYGDIMTDQDFGALRRWHDAREARVTLLVHKRANSNSALDMRPDGRVTVFRERPAQVPPPPGIGQMRRVFSGVCVCDPSVLELIPDSLPCDLAKDVLEKHAASGLVYGFELTGRRVAIDSQERLEQAAQMFVMPTIDIAKGGGDAPETDTTIL